MDDKKIIPWTAEWEQWNQYVEKQYDVARGIGIDVLKVLLNVVISLNIIPVIFHDKVFALFPEQAKFIYFSWILILVSVLSGFGAYFFIFEGYYFKALKEDWRCLQKTEPKEEVEKQIKNYHEKSNWHLDRAHSCGYVCLGAFVLAIVVLIIAVIIKGFYS